MSNPPLIAAFSQLLQQGRTVPDAANALARLQRLEQDQGSAIDWVDAAALLIASTPSLAIAVLDQGLQQWPDDIAMCYLRGNALRMSGNPAMAEAALRDVIARMPEHADASLSLAYLLREQGRMAAVAEVIISAWRRAPRSAAGDVHALQFLRECGRIADAALLLPTILGSPHEGARVYQLAGEIASALGEFDKAREYLAAAVAANADTPAAWLRLAHTHRFDDAADVDLQSLRAASARRDLSVDAQVCIGFGLGKAFDDLGDTAHAAQAFSVANERWHTRQVWIGDDWLEFVDRRMCASALPVRGAGAGITPVFIVGLPRTGTTLVANLLARDSRVRNRGELNWINALAGSLGSDPSATALDAAARLYLAQLRQDDAPAQVYIDKNPLNFRHLDLIGAMFPQARIVHCRRDARDTALSLWSAHFMHEDMAWTYDFDDIATYAKGYRKLIGHWRARSTLPIVEVDYATLVTDTDATVASLRDFVGLAGDRQPASVQAPDAIRTASVWQARQPVHAHSVGRWQRYAPYLPKFAAFASI